jgi:hypothetical protein
VMKTRGLVGRLQMQESTTLEKNYSCSSFRINYAVKIANILPTAPGCQSVAFFTIFGRF